MSRKEFKVSVKKAALKRANGRCEGCSGSLVTGQFHFDHKKAAGLAGPPTLENCQVLCVICHRAKTPKDNAIMRKADAQKAYANNMRAPRKQIPQPLKMRREGKTSLPPKPLFKD